MSVLVSLRAWLVALLIIGSSVVAFGQDIPFQVLKKPRPMYTDAARQNIIIGVIRLNVLFKADGTIGEITIVKSLPFGLTEEAILGAREIKFVPKTINGIPQDLIKPVEYRFDIYTDEKDKDIKKKAKIRKKPAFDFTESEKAEIKRLHITITISLHGDGVASLYMIVPEVDETLRSKIEEAVSKIEFEPAKLKGGAGITVTRELELK